jgi:glycosyltransferase involved in cell wall biosynthesis
MKVAIYTIALNEEQHVQRWADSTKDADYRLILDTGSTDDTYALAYGAGIDIHQQTFTPWRFDHARNHALSLLPEDIDICIALDMDEVLQPGWRQALETINPTTTRPRYKYVWSWKEDGSEGLVYGGDKIHRRNNYQWKHPVHETLKCEGTEIQQWAHGLEIHHHPDSSKSRSQYLPLLELALEEDPTNDRNNFYLAREYFFHNEPDKADYFFYQHLQYSNWKPERAASFRFLAKLHPHKQEDLLVRACAEDPSRRESWVSLAKVYHDKKMWQYCRNACFNALAVTTKPMDYLCEDWAWGDLPYDLMALSCFFLGLKTEAVKYGELAVEANPNDERLQTNLDFYRL